MAQTDEKSKRKFLSCLLLVLLFAQTFCFANNKKFLKAIAWDTWQYFGELVQKETNFLPPDHIRFEPEYQLADYTSTTNIGLYLICIVSAYDLKFISKDDALSRIEKVIATLKKLEKWKGHPYNYYNIKTLKVTREYISTVDNAWLCAGLIVAKKTFAEVIKDCESLLNEMDFGVLYDKEIGQLYLGYDTEKKEYSPYHYGLLNTEARIASLISIGKKDVEKKHWYKIYRVLPDEWTWQRQIPKGKTKNYMGIDVFQGYYTYKGTKVVPSWGGSMFESLMPSLVLKEKELSKKGFGLNNKRIIEIQIDKAKEKGYPVWGHSPCSCSDGEYREWGVEEIGAKGYPSGAVITPHATFLALEYLPEESIENAKK